MELKLGVLASAAAVAIVVGVACGGSTATSTEPTSAPSAGTGEATVAETSATADAVAEPTETVSAEPHAELSVPDLVVQAEPSIVRVQAVNSIGTGFVVSEDGFIITNEHVVESASRIGAVQVTLFDGSELEAEIVGMDPRADIALLKVDMTGLTALPLAELDDVVVGQSVVVIGFPLDLERGAGAAFTVTTGIVSAKNRQIRSTPFGILGAVQTDAAINSGNSGGPLINLYGEVVGVNTAIAINQTVGTVASGIGFAVGSDTVVAVYDELREDGMVDRALLGINGFEALSPAAGRDLGLPKDTTGVVVSAVSDGGPVGQAGLLPGDVIVNIGRFNVGNESELAEALIVLNPGNLVNVGVWRDSSMLSLSVTLGDAGEQ